MAELLMREGAELTAVTNVSVVKCSCIFTGY